jgi:hypothetical protein
MRSRIASSNVTRGSATMVLRVPLTSNEIDRSFELAVAVAIGAATAGVAALS